MNTKIKIASILLFIVSAVTIFFGFINLLSPSLVAYHQKFLGPAYKELEPRTIALFLIFMKTLGICFLSIGVGMAMLVKGAFMKGNKLSWRTLLAMSLILLIPLFFINISAGFYSPWPVTIAMLLLVIIAMSISKSSMSL